MRLFLVGATQTKHVKAVYEACGWSCTIPKKSDGNVSAKLGNVIQLFLSDMVYCVGNRDICGDRLLSLAKKLNKKIIIHWIGSDVIRERERQERGGEKINQGVINLAVTQQLCEELAALDICSYYVPIVPSSFPLSNIPPMPSSHGVMSYIPKGHEDFYGWQEVKKIAEAHLNIPFYIVANDGDGLGNVSENVIFKGYLPHSELIDLFEEISVLIRYTKHDGLPVMLLEAQALGRTVIYRFDLPHVIKPKDDSVCALDEVFSSVLLSSPEMNMAAKAYVDENFNIRSVVSIYKSLGLA